jgi:hypothetical protein
VVSSQNSSLLLFNRKDKKQRKQEKEINDILERMVDDQITVLAYKVYIDLSMKKDALRQRNKILSTVTKQMTLEVAQDSLNEFSIENSNTNIIDDFYSSKSNSTEKI